MSNEAFTSENLALGSQQEFFKRIGVALDQFFKANARTRVDPAVQLTAATTFFLHVMQNILQQYVAEGTDINEAMKLLISDALDSIESFRPDGSVTQ